VSRDLVSHLVGEDGPALTDKRIADWEDALRKALPYLPVVENVHYFLGRDPGAIRAVCPACAVPVTPPARRSGSESSEPYIPPEG
jgi:hypothetical protein